MTKKRLNHYYERAAPSFFVSNTIIQYRIRIENIKTHKTTNKTYTKE